jgi:chromosome segregation protein
VLKLRKVELLGFKSFCEKTQITFSGNGITCIVGPNGCGKSNIVDAISWVLGEQSHKLLRAERMSDCIFNGTAKRPPLGISEVILTLVDPDLSEAVAKVLEAPQGAQGEATADGATTEVASDHAANADAFMQIEAAAEVPAENAISAKFRKKRGTPPPPTKLGEVVIGRRLYRSGEAEYLMNGRVIRLRDIQQLFMTMGLGPDSYAIIEQGRIGVILNSKPMDRRAIIEEAAGVTMYKTKRRLAEAKLEASRVNLSRVNDILVEVEKQLASLKRQAAKARRFAELREQMRAALRTILASKAQQLDAEAERLERTLREMQTAEADATRNVRELETEQERLSARTYELEGELRQTQNLLGQTALDLDRAENRITFNQEQSTQLETRATSLALEIDQAIRDSEQLAARLQSHQETVASLRANTTQIESELNTGVSGGEALTREQSDLEAQIDGLRQAARQHGEESVRSHAEHLQASETAARLQAQEQEKTGQLAASQAEWTAQIEKASATEQVYSQATAHLQEISGVVREYQTKLINLREKQQEVHRAFEDAREALTSSRARRASLERILEDRAYSADVVQKLFASSSANASVASNGSTNGAGDFRVVGLLADYAEVEQQYESAVEQFLREELEYIVVASFDQARSGVALLRSDLGGRATFFVDSLRSLNLQHNEIPDSISAEGIVARLDHLIEFRDPLGPAAKHFLPKLQSTYLVETPELAESMATSNPHLHFLTLDGTCYRGRAITGGRRSDAGPLALKRELRMLETQAAELEQHAAQTQTELRSLESDTVTLQEHLGDSMGKMVQAEKDAVAAQHHRDQAQIESRRAEEQRNAALAEISALHSQAEAAQARATQAESQHNEALRLRETSEAQTTQSIDNLADLRRQLQSQQEQLTRKREELAGMSERLAGAEAVERQIEAESNQTTARRTTLEQQQAAIHNERDQLARATELLTRQTENLRAEKVRIEESQAALDREYEQAHTRSAQLDDTLRGQRQSLDEQRALRGQSEIEKTRNDMDRQYLRQSCVEELNAQPEELIGQETTLLTAEELAAAETTYNEMKTRLENMGAVNMMALEEFQECETREAFLRRERDDLVESIQNTQQAISELDQISRQKFEEAFIHINTNFAAAFQTLFGGGTGEMRLTEPDSSGESGIDIVAQPPGKRLQNILLLSGGEKALTALALLMAVFQYQPSPFCILDEVDAPLDEANVGRFNRMLKDMGTHTQFIVVTHNRKTMEMGSVMYGVTMQEPGVSKLVSVRWEEASPAAAEPALATNAA